MMTFCKKSVHSFLGLTNHPMNGFFLEKPSCNCHGVYSTSPAGGLGLISATSDTCKTPNVLESAYVKSTPPSSPPPSSSSSSSCSFLFKKYPGGIGFIDGIGGGVDGLMSCTESLGCESSDERRVDDDIGICSETTETTSKVKWRKGGERREAKKFPPPLSSFNHKGQPSFFLKPVRKDGRLELTEVRIDRPEILRSSRQDGRLKIHFVRNEAAAEDEEEEFDIKEEKDNQERGEIEEEEQSGEEEQNEEIEENIGEGREEESGEEWGFREGIRRCYEHHDYHHHHHHHHHNNNHHHNLHAWSQQCVPTR